MELIGLAALICREMTEFDKEPKRQIIGVKGASQRDVVTTLDTHLHQVVLEFVKSESPETVVMSEEGILHRPEEYWDSSSLLVVDPLDGSNNFALDIPGFGFMATFVENHYISSSLIILPERDLYLLWTGSDLITSRQITFIPSAPSASTYYAYPPGFTGVEMDKHLRMLQKIDDHSTGIYRSGSACVGLFQLLKGAHTLFVGNQVRVWDVLAFLPLLASQKMAIRYRIDGFSASLLASHDEAVVVEFEKEMADSGPSKFHQFELGVPLKVGQR